MDDDRLADQLKADPEAATSVPDDDLNLQANTRTLARAKEESNQNTRGRALRLLAAAYAHC